MQRSTLHIKLLPKRAAKTLKTVLEDLYQYLQKSPISSNRNTTTQGDMEAEFQRRKKEVNSSLKYYIKTF